MTNTKLSPSQVKSLSRHRKMTREALAARIAQRPVKMGDRRTKRLRDRGAARRNAIKEG